MRRFNTAGPCLPKYHYMIPALGRLPEVPGLVAQLGYFAVHAPPSLQHHRLKQVGGVVRSGDEPQVGEAVAAYLADPGTRRPRGIYSRQRGHLAGEAGPVTGDKNGGVVAVGGGDQAWVGAVGASGDDRRGDDGAAHQAEQQPEHDQSTPAGAHSARATASTAAQTTSGRRVDRYLGLHGGPPPGTDR